MLPVERIDLVNRLILVKKVDFGSRTGISVLIRVWG